MADSKLDDRLMFTFAHDMRSYIRTVLTRIQLIQTHGSLLPERDRSFLEEAVGAAGDMSLLLSAMVSYCSVAATPETTELSLMLRGINLEMKPLLAEAAAKLTIANDLNVQVSSALNIVLRELITNACRFRRMDKQTEIRVATRLASPETLEVTVADNGPGVEPAWQERIFEPFQRMNSRNKYPGFGLGLALCRRIVMMNGGAIAARDAAEGGLAILISLPVTYSIRDSEALIV